MSGNIVYVEQDDLGIITIDHPPVNALSHAVREGLIRALDQADGAPNVRAILIIGGGRTFIAGADIREFGKPMQAPSLHEVLDRLEAMKKPVIAAIHGTALGGGLEVALTCHWRVALNGSQLGLPEVKLGILPGAGGTQRLPRLVGVETALQMITSGNPISAKQARELGLVDELVEGDLLAQAKSFARMVIDKPQALRLVSQMNEKVTDVPADLFTQFRQTIERKAKGYFAPWRCIDAVEAACTLPFPQGLQRERELFIQCMDSPQRKAQIHVFFAEREVAKIPDLPTDLNPPRIQSAAIIGAGTMGGGIAMNFANVGIPVRLLEKSQEALSRGLALIEKNYRTSVERGSMSEGAMQKALGLIRGVQNYQDISDADIVIEAVFEDMAVKKDVFATLDQVMKPGAILASNTSTLDIDEIAAATSRPQSVIGTHFFSPANVMRLLENVRGQKTSAATIAAAMAMGKQIRKTAVLAGNCDGFIGNRMLAGYGREANFLLEEGALPWQIDRVLVEFGMPMGPFAMGDLAGNDVGWRIRKGKAHLRDPHERYCPIADRLCEMGRFGQKTGSGWYKYEGRKAIPDPVVEDLILQVSKEKGLTRRVISDAEILSRCLYPLVNEGARILEEGIAIRASDIDIVWIYGYGFPLYRGGPMFWAEQEVGLANLLRTIEDYRAQHGERFWTPSPLLVRRVQEGKGWAG